MHWPSPFSRRLTDWAPYALAVAALATLVVVLAALAIRQEHDRRRQYATSVTRNMALLIEAQLAAVLAQADLSLQARGAVMPGQASTWAAGHVTPAPGLRVRGPLKDAGGRWVMQLARASAQAGQAELSVDLPVEQLGAILDRVELGRHGAATIRNAELALVYRQPLPQPGTAGIGGNGVSAELRQAIAAQPEAGDYAAATAMDGVARINAYQRVDGYPLYVLVGLPEDDFPSGWSRRDAALLTIAALTLLVSAYAALQLYRTSRRQINAAYHRYEAIVESSHDAIICKALDGTVLSWNAAAERIYGWTAAEMLGQPLSRIFPPERQEEEAPILSRLQRGDTVEPFETERLHRDGRRIALSVAISPVRDAQGRILGASKIARDITQQKRMEAEIRDMAFHDALTRLPNRRLLLDRMHHAQQTHQRTGSWAALLFLDLDRFKELNDQHGHEAGDRMLIEVAQRLRHAVRESDTVARLGGDEFVVLCENLGPDAVLAREAVLAIEAKVGDAIGRPMQLGELHYHGRASVGHRLFLGNEDTSDQILHDADSAMYADKQRRQAQPYTSH
ncbi:MAG: diguanylate cyclase [Burkholderiales bacterium]|nr:diguanylate cyclase [Burkholderiales bacterium]